MPPPKYPHRSSSRWTGVQLSLVLLVMAATASISAFYLGQYAHEVMPVMHQHIDRHTQKTGEQSSRRAANALSTSQPAAPSHA
jgi:hypothetical protein